MNSIEIVSMGRCVPQRILTNDDLSKMVDTNDEWIVTRTGIHQRHIVDEGMTNADIATQAARDALDRASVDPNTLAAIIVATFTPDMFVPTVSATVHDRLGLNPATLALDLNGACCGFIYAMRTAQGLLALNPISQYSSLLLRQYRAFSTLLIVQPAFCLAMELRLRLSDHRILLVGLLLERVDALMRSVALPIMRAINLALG
jgi:hypothetical protein